MKVAAHRTFFVATKVELRITCRLQHIGHLLLQQKYKTSICFLSWAGQLSRVGMKQNLPSKSQLTSRVDTITIVPPRNLPQHQTPAAPQSSLPQQQPELLAPKRSTSSSDGCAVGDPTPLPRPRPRHGGGGAPRPHLRRAQGAAARHRARRVPKQWRMYTPGHPCHGPGFGPKNC